MRTVVKRPLDNPVSDLHEALGLLVENDHRSGGYLCLNALRAARLKEGYGGPRIVRQHMGGYGDMSVVGENIYFVTEELAQKLKYHYTHGTAHWGRTDEFERHADERGERAYWDEFIKRRDAAEAVKETTGVQNPNER